MSQRNDINQLSVQSGLQHQETDKIVSQYRGMISSGSTGMLPFFVDLVIFFL